MPNPYEDFFEENKKRMEQEPPPLDDHRFELSENYKEPLDEILEKVEGFNKKAEFFSRLLSEVRAVDHRVEKALVNLFFKTKDKHDKGNLADEKAYHRLLCSKFRQIVKPMRELAEIHLETVKQFNRDIDKDYYSLDKTDKRVKIDKSIAIDGINLQRKILADATEDLEILESALVNTEKRLKNYINVGGLNNISASEAAIITQKRITLTDGRDYHFNHTFFKINMLDKTAISLGMYMKETTSQYLAKLSNALH